MSVSSLDMCESPAPDRSYDDRESLMLQRQFKSTGFTPRPLERLVRKKPDRTSLDIEIQHQMRCSRPLETAHGKPGLTQKLWKEAGRHSPPFPYQHHKVDRSFNSNVWRNFAHTYGLTAPPNSKVNELVANLYPLNMPAPSRMRGHTFTTFIRDMPMQAKGKMKQMLEDRTEQEFKTFEYLRIKSEMRRPPLDEKGNIAPPFNYKRHMPKLITPTDSITGSTKRSQSQFTDGIYQNDIPAPPPHKRIDMFGQEVPVVKEAGPHLYKLTYRFNNPTFKQVREDIEKKKSEFRTTPYLSASKAF